jgi:gluconate 5-dehydrogenase
MTDTARTVQDLFKLNGKTALITGGSRGLGLQMAHALGEAGARIMLSSRKAEDLEEAIIPSYVKQFSADDIKQLIAFYESPFGRKVTRAMPQIMQECNEIGINWGQNIVTRVATKWRKEGKLTEREYEQLVGPEEQPR